MDENGGRRSKEYILGGDEMRKRGRERGFEDREFKSG
jgi:hypothetical protein